MDGKTVTAKMIIDFLSQNRFVGGAGGGPGGGKGGAGGGAPAATYAQGVDMIVPPGYPNDSYPMNVQSGERVIVIPRADQARGSGVPGNSYNLSIYTNAPVESMVKDFNMMRSWARA